MNDIFISYNSKDEKMAIEYYNAFTKKGFTCWMDLFNISPKGTYAESVPAAIKNSEVFVFLLSENSQKSVWNKKELGYAVSMKDKDIISINIDECMLIDDYKFLLQNCVLLQHSNVNDTIEKISLMFNKNKAQTAPSSDNKNLSVKETPLGYNSAVKEKTVNRDSDIKDIFISHSSKDNEIALNYYNVLTERGFKCWMDLFNIPPGENYRGEIPAAIKNCQYFVFLLSEHSQISKYAEKEFIIAEDEGKIIIPINIDGCILNDSWKWSLSNIQILTSSRNVNEDTEKIVSVLSRGKNTDKLKKEALEKENTFIHDNHPDALNKIDDIINKKDSFAYYAFKSGHYENAVKMYSDVLENCKTDLGKSHPATLSTMQNLAAAYSKLGKYEESLKLHNEIVEEKKCAFGENHPDTLTAMYDLATVYFKLGKYKESYKLVIEVIEKRKVVLGENHPDTLEAINNLAITYYYLGKIEESLCILKSLYDKAKIVFGDKSKFTNNIVNTICEIENNTQN